MPKTPEPGAQILRRAARRRIRPLLGGAGALSIWQVCEALVPVAIGIIVDRAIIPLSIPAFVISIIGLGLLFTVLSLGYRFGARLCNSAREDEAHALRVEITHAALTAPSLPADRCGLPPHRRPRDHGQVVEEGTHADLVAAGGRYAELWEAWSG